MRRCSPISSGVCWRTGPIPRLSINSSDEKIPIEELIADPVAEAARLGGAPHALIALPRDLFGSERKNSKGLDLSDVGRARRT